MNDLPETMEGLSAQLEVRAEASLAARVEALERRVYALEHSCAAVVETAEQEAAPLAGQPRGETFFAGQSGGAFAVLGKAMLGIAGAYLLRAAAESSALPRPAVAAVAIAYAIGWLVWASRAKAENRWTGTMYACTSALIFAPMLWELTLRFRVLSAPLAAGVVFVFVTTAWGVTWKRDVGPVLWTANVTGVLIAPGLAIASRQLAPFIAVLLAMVLVCEWRADREG